MAEAALFSIATKLLSTINSPAFNAAYDKAFSIWGARDELDKLGRTVKTIQAVLLDAERRQESSAAIKDWIKRVRDVLYEADDLFDEVATNDLLRQQVKGNKLVKQVRVASSFLNPIITSNNIANKVKAIRKSLLQISEDMAQFNFVVCQHQEVMPVIWRGREQGCFVDPKVVYGRDKDKNVILEFLFGESNVEQNVSLISIVGVGGMGKTTLAQLVYNDESVKSGFDKRWWACISDIEDEKEVIGRIFQALTDGKYQDLSVSQLETGIRNYIEKSGKFLLVLDDLWDEKRDRGQKLRSLLGGVAKGSRIVVTTRSPLVGRAMDADKIHELKGLSEDDSWDLFRRLAFPQGRETDPDWISVGREIAKKCKDVPLAIKSIACLMFSKNNLEDWVSFKDVELFKIDLSENPTMAALKLSYDHLNSNLKHCFAYCALFPKGLRLDKVRLIYLWAAQGYIEPENQKQTVEEVGSAYFMELVTRSFFQEGRIQSTQISCFKIHDLFHDLAQHVSGGESTTLSTQSRGVSKSCRHISVDYDTGNSWKVPPSLVRENRVRSLFLKGMGRPQELVVDKSLTKLTFLRVLDLGNTGIEVVPDSIGSLKHLRFLDLSYNHFRYLPDSITTLVNLLVLNLRWCEKLETLPTDLRKLVSLRCLFADECLKLRCLPAGIGELTSLQRLDGFVVAKEDGSKSSRLDALAQLKLKGLLTIEYKGGPYEDLDENELAAEISQVPTSVEHFDLRFYPGVGISTFPGNVVTLGLSCCRRVKHLPSLKCLPYLKTISLWKMDDLEYVEADEEADQSATLFFPCLEELTLSLLPKLKGWSSNSRDNMASFPLLSSISISGTPKLQALPLAPQLGRLVLTGASLKLVQQLTCCNSSTSSDSGSSSSLSYVLVSRCHELTSFSAKGLRNLQHLMIANCDQLKSVDMGSQLELLGIWGCHQLKLWEDENGEVDWGSLPNLRLLTLDEVPDKERLPDCLRCRQHLDVSASRPPEKYDSRLPAFYTTL